MTPTARDAANRTKVRLADGRTGELLYWPIPVEQRNHPVRSGGARAKVRLISGTVLSVDVDAVTVIE